MNVPDSEERGRQIRQELEICLKSRAFRGSKRSQLFLSHVVERALEGCEEITERSIGVAVFGRDATYEPSNDAIVRGTVRDVRNRLALFNLGYKDRPVWIDLPHGSYVPEFHWPEAGSPVAEVPQLPYPHVAEEEAARPAMPRQKWWRWAAALSALCALLLGMALWVAGRRQMLAPPTVLERFWSPLVSVPEPVLICAPTPVTYDFRGPVRERFGTMPPQSSSPLQVTPITFPPDGIVYGREIVTFADLFIGEGDAQAMAQFAAMLGRMGKPFELKTASRTSLDDLRHTPAILIGAYTNDWSGRENEDLPFVFTCDPTHLVSETGLAKRQWIPAKGPQGQDLDDYALVTRLWDPSVGQYVVLAAGIMNYGTQAAGEFLTNPVYLAEAFRNVSSNWSKQNIQIVLHVSVVDRVAGAPRVAAVKVW